MTQRGRDHYGVLVERQVSTRTLARLLNLHYGNMRKMGEVRGFNERHLSRLELAADLVGRLPKREPADPWLKSPHPALSGRSPVDVIAAYGADAPILEGLPTGSTWLAAMPRQRWWTTFLALVEVPTQPDAVVRHLQQGPPQEGRGGEEYLTIDVRWMWPPDGYPTTFVIAEVGALQPPMRSEGRWATLFYGPLRDNTRWDSLGYGQPLRDSLLTHWHQDFKGAYVGTYLNDTPVPIDIFDRWSFIRRELWRPPSPPWDRSDSNLVTTYLRRLTEGGPPVADDYWTFPSIRQGRKAEMWSLWRPFVDEEMQVDRGHLHRYRYESFLGERVNTAIRHPDGAADPGDARAVRILTEPEARP